MSGSQVLSSGDDDEDEARSESKWGRSTATRRSASASPSHVIREAGEAARLRGCQQGMSTLVAEILLTKQRRDLRIC